MRIKVDEDLPAAVARAFVEAGHDALSVADEGLAGADDARLWKVAQSERRLLVTADKGFADIRLHPPGTHAGIVLLRAEQESRRAYIRLAQALIRTGALERLAGGLAVVTPRGTRVRRG
ncbi:MAG: DUF5615 family PIN-like protein [Deltaproteobacteria bacterium]|nr:DUF5615 family PIN-like protein [Deltaproteobacteria bacterium]